VVAVSKTIDMLNWSDWAGPMPGSTNASFWLANASLE